MKDIIHITPFDGQTADELPVEMVETKGLGHPDTICDCLAEEASLSICKYYLENHELIKHFNVDKALLVGGNANPHFGGGEMTHPIEFILAGRIGQGEDAGMVSGVKRGIKHWLRNNLRYIDPEKDFEIKIKLLPGSGELIDLSSPGHVPLANDTSFGTGFYPFSRLERVVKEAAHVLNDTSTRTLFPFVGEDIKVMGLRMEQALNLIISVAMVSKFVSGLDDYQKKLDQIRMLLMDKIQPNDDLVIEINKADNFETGNIYMTVTGTSAEQGDDGQVGRGNRINGLITPYRPMSLEAVSGKNPFNHVGKLYNHLAQELSEKIVALDLANAAQVFLVSKIGQPINQPQLMEIKAIKPDKEAIRQLAKSMLKELPVFYKEFVARKISTCH